MGMGMAGSSAGHHVTWYEILGIDASAQTLLSRYHTGFFRRELLSFQYVTHDPLIRSR